MARTRVRAAVLSAVGAPLEITGIDLPATGPGRVRVRLAAAGVCHSDLSLSNGTMRVPVPAVLGHEGAGTVVSVGEGVTHVALGDPVVLNWAPSCGDCHHCGLGEVWLCANALSGAGDVYARTADGTDLHPGLNVAAFAEETVVAANCVLPVPDGIPLTDAALLGCAVLTGYGAVHHSARVRAGESVAVFGVGGVGLAVLQSARIAGAGQIVAVDVSPEKEELARAAGATDFVIASQTTAKEIRKLTGAAQGVDVAIECVGRAVTIRTAWDSTRRGGRTTVVGIGGKDQQVTFNALEIFHFGRTLSGCVYGNSDPARDLPVLAEHIRAGRLDLGSMVTERIGLDGIPAAFDNMLAGKGGRALVVF
ncbi:Zn-dependent alcohol dehydrogenase [Streptomyces flavidovirens]|uniref:Zn-dependent alcohol dehydrogenase n=1 Tax=Streptomyces flavidovirens TaxID=67298 RepID=UPI000417CD62|nr:Zn-dependent alcohol dehydrogenase [Streptomyces flavidovirens]